MSIKVIDNWNLSSKPITHETKALDVTIGSHTNKVVFNVISSPKNLVIIGLSWLALHNPQVDWHMTSLHFETPRHKALEYETLINNMQNLKQKENLDGTKKPRCPKLLFLGAKAFMKVVKKGDAFLIYALPSPDVESCAHEIPFQYHEFKDAFEKKNAYTLPKHRPYDYTLIFMKK
jgi:hypothetical protein